MTKINQDTTPHPEWICFDCGVKHGRRVPTIATWHGGKCGVCGLAGIVTEPRDFGHLMDGWQHKFCRGCGQGEGHEYTTCDGCGQEICPDCEADIDDDGAPVNLCEDCCG